MTLNEYQVRLHDDRFNFMGLGEVKEVNFLNFDPFVEALPALDLFENWSIILTLSPKVIYQKRIVYDVFMMFGDVGGLNDFLAIICAPGLGLLSEGFMLASIVKSLFMQSLSSKK